MAPPDPEKEKEEEENKEDDTDEILDELLKDDPMSNMTK